MRAVCFLLFLGCSRSPSTLNPQSSADTSAPPATATADEASGVSGPPPSARSVVTFTGMCDASAAVELTDRTFAVADDEDNVIRTYDAERGGAPLAAVDLSAGLALPLKRAKKSKPNAKPPPPLETDLEAATRIGDRAYWITSHARKRSGKRAPERVRFFATTAPNDGTPVALVGVPHEHLLEDLLAEPRLERFGLARAVELAPSEPGGFNLEGMTAREEGGVWLGLRNPVPEGKALLIPLLNPDELVSGGRASFGEPRLLELGGLGVRSLSAWRKRYLIAGGSSGDGGTPRLFTWDGTSAPRPFPSLDLTGFNPEGFFSPDGREEIFVLSDDGTVIVDGAPCKKLEDTAKKRFRGAWVSMAFLGARDGG
jgi:hypothetical protein